MRKKVEIILIVLILICFLYPAYIIFEITGGLNPPKPKIKYAEFPIKVTCRVSGEEYTIEDTVICEYKGVKNVGIGGKTRVWEDYLKSTNSVAITILNGEEDGGTFEIYKWAGCAEYYMGEPDYGGYNLREIESPDGFYINHYNENGREISRGWITREEAFEKYGFELVSVEYTPPLVGNCD